MTAFSWLRRVDGKPGDQWSVRDQSAISAEVQQLLRPHDCPGHRMAGTRVNLFLELC